MDKLGWRRQNGHEFESLVIDSAKARSWDMFHMYEDTGTILISERVKRALEHIPFLTFQPVANIPDGP